MSEPYLGREPVDGAAIERVALALGYPAEAAARLRSQHEAGVPMDRWLAQPMRADLERLRASFDPENWDLLEHSPDYCACGLAALKGSDACAGCGSRPPGRIASVINLLDHGISPHVHPEIRKVLALVCKTYQYPASVILSKDRTKRVAEARHIAMWVARQRGFSYPELGREFAYEVFGQKRGRDHTTVMSSVRAVENNVELLAKATTLNALLEPTRDEVLVVRVKRFRVAKHIELQVEVPVEEPVVEALPVQTAKEEGNE